MKPQSFSGGAVVLLAFPTLAHAHGEQILVYPAATFVLLLFSAIALSNWSWSRRESRR